MKTRDLVTIKGTKSILDGEAGKILGKSINGLVMVWIVELINGPIVINQEEYFAITMPESCLELNTAPNPILTFTSADYSDGIHGHNGKSYQVSGGHKMGCAECCFLYYKDIGEPISFERAKEMTEAYKAF
jgi:hypothetical protein